MILGRLSDWTRTRDSALFAPVITFLQTSANSSLEVGKHSIEGEEIFALVAKSPSRAPSEGKFEAHRKYVDVQYLIAGAEEIGVRPTCELVTGDGYDAEKDLEFFQNPTEYSRLRMQPGMFAVFFPEDGHLPNCHLGGVHDLHKVVVKVSLRWLSDRKL